MPKNYFNAVDQLHVMTDRAAVLQTVLRQARRECLALLQLMRVIERTHNSAGMPSFTAWRTAKKFMRAYTVYDQTKRELFALHGAVVVANVIQDNDYRDLEAKYGPVIASDVYARLPKTA